MNDCPMSFSRLAARGTRYGVLLFSLSTQKNGLAPIYTSSLCLFSASPLFNTGFTPCSLAEASCTLLLSGKASQKRGTLYMRFFTMFPFSSKKRISALTPFSTSSARAVAVGVARVSPGIISSLLPPSAIFGDVQRMMASTATMVKNARIYCFFVIFMSCIM